MQKKYKAINLSNVRSGGALQVALSFLLDIENYDLKEFDIIISTELKEELKRFKYKNSSKFIVYNTNFLSLFSLNHFLFFRDYKFIFNLFGPFFSFNKAFQISGFAQAWIIFKSNHVYSKISYLKGFFFKFKYSIHKYFYSKSNVLITEAQFALKKLRSIFPEKNIYYVSNSLNTVFKSPDLWSDIKINSCYTNKIRIGVMGRDYIHKNLNSIVAVKKIIRDYYNLDTEFYVTLYEKEFSSKNKSFKAEVINLGPLKINQCADFYQKMDLIFFPSLLEIFSATIIESLFFKKPLICCNLEFNKAVCLDYAIYFEPNNNFDAAQKIFESIQNIKNPIFMSKLEEASDYIINNYSSNRRTNNYLNILNDHIHDK